MAHLRNRVIACTAPAALALIVAACHGDTTPAANGAQPQGAAPAETPAAERYVDAVDIGALVKPFLSPEGYLDPEFVKAISAPSPYFTDFYGAQALATTSREKIVRDFVPQYASEVASGPHSITLKFHKGYTAEFFPNSALSVMNVNVPFDHAIVSGDDWRAILDNLADFRQVIQTAGLADEYLIPNPYYEDEKVVAEQLANGSRAPVKVDPQLAAYAKDANAVLLMPEAVHGKDADAMKLMELIKEHDIDWLGLEMLPVEKQPELDAYNAAKAATPAYEAARSKLVDYFAESWNGRAGPKTTGEENYYFKLVEAAHAQGVRVVALEGASMEYILFRNGESRFGGAVRSYLWAKEAPSTGRGVVFGGSAHFTSPDAVNVQDFLVRRSPGRLIVSLKDLAPKK